MLIHKEIKLQIKSMQRWVMIVSCSLTPPPLFFLFCLFLVLFCLKHWFLALSWCVCVCVCVCACVCVCVCVCDFTISVLGFCSRFWLCMMRWTTWTSTPWFRGWQDCSKKMAASMVTSGVSGNLFERLQQGPMVRSFNIFILFFLMKPFPSCILAYKLLIKDYPFWKIIFSGDPWFPHIYVQVGNIKLKHYREFVLTVVDRAQNINN